MNDLATLDAHQTRMRPLWRVVRDVHAAAYLPNANLREPPLDADRPAYVAGLTRDAGLGDGYLVQRGTNESPEAFAFMARLVDPDGLFGFAIGSLAGQIDAAEADLMRQWTDADGAGPFGSPDEPGTEAARLSTDADGKGTNWSVLWGASRATDLLLFQEFWVVALGVRTETLVVEDPVTGETREQEVERPPSVRVLPPWACVRTWSQGNTTTGARFVHTESRPKADAPGETEAVTVYTDYLLGGWRRWEVVGQAAPAQTANGAYAYFEAADKAVPALPCFRATLGLRSYHAYLWARKRLNAINLRMRYDGALFLANTPYLHHRSTALDPAEVPAYQDPGVSDPEPTMGPVGAALVSGYRFFETPSKDEVAYVEPQLAVASVTKEALEQKDRDFQQQAYQLMGQESREVSATEIRQRSASGTDAILAVVSKALDEAETRAMFLLAQTLDPDGPDGWGVATATRSTNFVAADEGAEAGQLADKVFGEAPPPIGETAQLAALRRYCDKHGLGYDDDEMRADLQAWRVGRGLVSGARREEIRARFDPPPVDA